MTWRGAAAGVLLSAIVAPCLTGEAQAQATEYRGPARIIDGDTIEIGATRIRFHGIDAPEKAQTCKAADGSMYACGQRSTAYLRQLIGGRIVVCNDMGPAINNRRRGRCFAGGTDLQAAMARAGHAIAFLAHGSDYVSQAEAAKAEKRGIWAGSFNTPGSVRKCRRAGKSSILGTRRTTEACS